jgi:uracil-DNA glycosylase
MNRGLRRDYLAAMGLETWVVRTSAAADLRAAPSVTPLPPPPQPVRAPEPVQSASPPRPVSAVPQARRPAEAPPPTVLDRPSPAVVADAQREAAYDWIQLRERVAACTRCGLSATRTQTVFGVGNLQAEWLVVGEAPGAEEDRQGEPFVGRAGLLLNSMLRAIGLAREQVYIANVLKCRPPHNRDPLASETVECLPYLERQIGLLKPKIMLVVGRIAAQNLLRTDVPLGRLRQQVHVFGDSRVPLVVTYHPAYLLRTPMDKRKAWEDLKFAREVFARG